MEVRVNQALTGQKHAVLWKNILQVSPAMHSLMLHASAKELVAILKSMKVLNFDGKPEHDIQWHIDSWQIEAARLKNPQKNYAG